MKLDMHCHVKEGSPDSKVPLDEYITKLKEHGFDGIPTWALPPFCSVSRLSS